MRTPRIKILAQALLIALAVPMTARAQVSVTVNAGTAVRTVDARVLGVNTACWDWSFDTAASGPLLAAMNIGALRYPGGGTADLYFWTNNEQQNTDSNNNPIPGSYFVEGTDFDHFASVARAQGSQAFITVNYGTSTPTDAANWVAYSKSKGYGFKYWEVGNENYGTWETDINTPKNDPVAYGTRFIQYYNQMKAADPTIRVGAVSPTSTEGVYNYPSETVTDPVTNLEESGWLPVMLSTMKKGGVMPDFLICHRYEQNSGQEDDAALLQLASSPTTGWNVDAAILRNALKDFYGSAAPDVELCVTENNSVHNNPGKQIVSLVNGLYAADSLGSLLQTEFNSLVWWAFRNGPNVSVTNNGVTVLGNNSSSLYGWLEFGDYGVVATDPGTSAPPGYPAINTPFPVFYAKKLLSHLAGGGDTVVGASSNNALVSAYAVKRTDGTLSILLINKDPATPYTVNLAIAGFTPAGNGTLYSYGIPQDNAAKTGTGSPDVTVSSVSGAAASFSVSVAPYSLNLYSLSSPTSPPIASSQPVSQAVATGTTAVFSFMATGAPAPTYQWYLNGTAVASATQPTLVINGATAASAGTYTCEAKNSSGTLTSNPATLTVVATADPGRLTNISCRAPVGTGGNILIAGFAVGGGSSGSEPLLIRASGPALALAPFDLVGTLPDPELQLFETNPDGSSTLLFTNKGWEGDAGIASVAASKGAFPWSNASSLDAALYKTLGAGPYTAQIAGQYGDTGIALAEIYDATATYTPASPRLINISARVPVGTGGNILIAGFYIGGSTSMTVLIRASGPSLGEFGLAGVLPDPELQLFRSNADSSSTLLYANDGWGGSAQIASTAANVGAFDWETATSADSALLVTLPPGGYTAQVSGASGDTGLALVEVYEVH